MNAPLAAPLAPPTAPAQAEQQSWRLAGGHIVRLHPLAISDAAAEQAFYNGLSLDSRHKRFHFGLRELSPALLRLLTDVDQRLHRAWAVESLEPGLPFVADARYVRDPERSTVAEFALAVADAWQGRGLGRRLVAHLIAHAGEQGVRRLYGDVLAENRRMLGLMRETGFRLQAHPDGPQLVRAVVELGQA